VKKFSTYINDTNSLPNQAFSKIKPPAFLTKKQLQPAFEVSQADELVISEVLFKTLSLVCDVNLELKNFQAAKLACKDLEILRRSDSNTYLMKLRVILHHLA